MRTHTGHGLSHSKAQREAACDKVEAVLPTVSGDLRQGQGTPLAVQIGVCGGAEVASAAASPRLPVLAGPLHAVQAPQPVKPIVLVRVWL